MRNNLVTGSGYGFGGYNHQKAEYCAFYGAASTESVYSNCVIENNTFWDLRYHLLKATPTSIHDGRGFVWKNNIIIQQYGHWFGRFASDLVNCKGYVMYRYNHDNLKRFYTLGTFDTNQFLYTLKAGQTDPANAYAQKENIVGQPMRLIAFVDANLAGTISDGDEQYYNYDKYVSDRDYKVLTAIPGTGHAAAYWTRITQADGTRVFIDGSNSLNAYPLGASVFYQPVFIDQSVTLNVNYLTGLIMDNIEGYTEYDSEEYQYDNGITLTVKYYRPENEQTSELTIKYYGSTYAYDVKKQAKYAEGYLLKGDVPNTKWVATVGGKKFTLSYNTNYLFNYMFAAGTDVHIDEERVNGSDNTNIPILNNMMAWKDEVNNFASFTASFELPEGYTRINHGVLMAADQSLLENVSDSNGQLYVPNGVIVGRISNNQDPSPVYTVSKRLTGNDDTWYGRAYVTYKYNGETYTRFANSIISTEGTTTFVTVTESGVVGDFEVYSPSIGIDSFEILH